VAANMFARWSSQLPCQGQVKAAFVLSDSVRAAEAPTELKSKKDGDVLG